MGRVHKKKLAEYAEAAENDELNKSSEHGEEAEKEKLDKSASEDSENENESNAGAAVAAEASAIYEGEEEEEEDDADEDFKSLPPGEEEGGEQEKNGKKPNKRKASEKAAKKVEADAEADDDSDNEPLNGGSPAKKARKPAAKAKQPKAAAAGGRGRGKVAKKAVDKSDEVEEEYEVKEIIDHKMERGVSHFLIRWKGYTKNDDTWEPEDTLSCPDLIEKFKKKQSETKSSKKGAAPIKKGRPAKGATKEDPNKEWEVEKIIDYAEEKGGRIFRIRWKGFGPKFDTWEPEDNLYCNDIIQKFMKRMKTQENVSFKELREEPKKTKRLVNETAPRTNYSNPIGRKSKRSGSKKRVYYGGDSDE